MSPYSHFQHLPYAYEPLKTIYVVQRVFTTLLLVPLWVVYYSVTPRSLRPRKSWSIKQILAVNFTRRVYKVTEMAGVTWNTRNPNQEPNPKALKETRFEWADPLPETMRTGILNDEEVPFVRVGAFVWPKQAPKLGMSRRSSQDNLQVTAESSSQVDIEAISAKVPKIGLFTHGGGYCHMSAEEKCSTSRIPRRLIKSGYFTEIYSVEYRLLQDAPFPAPVQDAAAVYTHIVNRYSKTVGGKGCEIILIGDSSGGNLVLSLTRWIRDERRLPPPDGLLLLSPSCDASHAFPVAPSAYIPRPHESTDYLVDTPEPRALLQKTFLGHHPIEMIHSPYVSPASERVLRAFYGDKIWESIAKNAGVDINEYALAHYHRLEEDSRTEIVELEAPIKRRNNGIASTPSFYYSNPNIRLLRQISSYSPRQLSLFEAFPKTCIVLGEAERLEAEVLKLVSAMEHDGVKVNVIGAKDAVHDILIMKWWDERVREEVWRNIFSWLKTFDA